MSRLPKTLAIGVTNSVSLETLDYIVPANTVTSASLVLTNQSSENVTMTIVINNGADDFVLVKKTIPGGNGKAVRVIELPDLKLSEDFQVKLQADKVAPVTHFLSGSEVTDDTAV